MKRGERACAPIAAISMASIYLALSSSGCASGKTAPELVRNPWGIEAAGSGVRFMAVTRGGVRREAAVLVAPAEISLPLASVAGGPLLRLRGLAAPLFNVGDGVLLELSLAHPAGGTSIWQKTFNPGLQEGDRRWNAIEAVFELRGQGGARATELELRVTAGSRGDLTADWLALSGLELVALEPGS